MLRDGVMNLCGRGQFCQAPTARPLIECISECGVVMMRNTETSHPMTRRSKFLSSLIIFFLSACHPTARTDDIALNDKVRDGLESVTHFEHQSATNECVPSNGRIVA